MLTSLMSEEFDQGLGEDMFGIFRAQMIRHMHCRLILDLANDGVDTLGIYSKQTMDTYAEETYRMYRTDPAAFEEFYITQLNASPEYREEVQRFRVRYEREVLSSAVSAASGDLRKVTRI